MKSKIQNQRVLFVIPPTKSMFGNEKGIPAHPHVGIAYLIAVLKKNENLVEVFDCGLNDSDEELYSKIEEFDPAIIGITGFSYAYGYLEETINKLKVKFKIPIIIGGPHVSATNAEILEKTSADFGFYGEGEEAFPIFLKEFAKDKPRYENVPGLIWKKGKKIIQNNPPEFILDLNKLPFPDYEAFGLDKYLCYKEKFLPILTSRGCPYQCNYCSVRLSMGYRFRPRNPQNVIDEIKHWYNKGFWTFDINDDCFTLDMDRSEKICDLIIKNKLKVKFQLYNGVRVDRVTPHLLKKLKKAGCSFIAFGCEAGNEETLKSIKKGITLDQVRKAVDWANQAGIKNAVNFIIGHKEETYEQALDSLKFAESLPTNFVNFYNLVPYPGTEVYDWASKNAKFLVNEKTFLKNISYRDNIPIFETKEFTKGQREEIMEKGFALYERKVLEFRLGKILGRVFFYLTRVSFMGKFFRNLVYKSKIAAGLYRKLSARSKE